MNHSFLNSNISEVAIHIVGNKANDELNRLSTQASSFNKEIADILTAYFTSAFKLDEYYNLYHAADLSLNEVYVYLSKIFDAPECLHEQSVNLANHLYEQSNHPKIKGGEFYVAYFKNCIIDGKNVDAVGLFKSEKKDTFLKVNPSGKGFEIESMKGVNVNKLDKGALVFNIERENGYVVTVVDNTNKGLEAHYWMDDFLHVRQRKDEYFNTHQVLSMCKGFASKELDNNKPAKSEFLNKSVQFFKEKDTFDMNKFANEVIEQPDIINSFNQYRESYAKEHDIDFSEGFNISDSAVKKQVRSFKSVIKLDKNFQIYIHGNRELIEQGEDNKGKFYKVYYKEEQ